MDVEGTLRCHLAAPAGIAAEEPVAPAGLAVADPAASAGIATEEQSGVRRRRSYSGSLTIRSRPDKFPRSGEEQVLFPFTILEGRPRDPPPIDDQPDELHLQTGRGDDPGKAGVSP